MDIKTLRRYGIPATVIPDGFEDTVIFTRFWIKFVAETKRLKYVRDAILSLRVIDVGLVR